MIVYILVYFHGEHSAYRRQQQTLPSLSRQNSSNIKARKDFSTETINKKQVPYLLLSLLISKSMTISTILFLIKKKLELKSTDSLFVFANRTLLQSNESVGELAGKYARGDGCLVI